MSRALGHSACLMSTCMLRTITIQFLTLAAIIAKVNDMLNLGQGHRVIVIHVIFYDMA